MGNQYATNYYIRAWYFFFTLLCVTGQWLLPPMREALPWRAAILIIALLGLYNLLRSMTTSIVVEEEGILLNLGLKRRRVVGWGQISRVEHRDVSGQHTLRIYTLEGLALETSSRWIVGLEELTDIIVTKARLTGRGPEGDRLAEGLWEVWTVQMGESGNGKTDG